jgi:PAS domain-containing protein
LLSSLHLGGAFFTPSIGPTVHALTELAPYLLVPVAEGLIGNGTAVRCGEHQGVPQPADHQRRHALRPSRATACNPGRFGPARPGQGQPDAVLAPLRPGRAQEGEVMTAPQVDYAAVYRQLPVPVLLLTPEFVIADANEAYLHTMGRTREELLGRNVVDAFPDNPSDPGATGVRNSMASAYRAQATGEPDAMEFQKYDIEVSPGLFARRYWSMVNGPVFGPDGRVVLIANCPEEVTDRMRRFMSALAADAEDEGPA